MCWWMLTTNHWQNNYRTAEGRHHTCSGNTADMCRTAIGHRSSNTCCKEKFWRGQQWMPAIGGCRQCLELTQQKSQSRKHQKTVYPMYTYLHNSYNTPAMLYLENDNHILSQEGVTQGDNAAMAMYALSTRPMIQALSNETANDEVKQYGMQMIVLQSDHWQAWKNGGNTYRPMDQTLGTALNLHRQNS